MKNIFLKVFAFSCIIMISSCASVQTGHLFQKELSKKQDEATVYIYRPDVWPASVITPMLYLDGQETLRLPELGYIVLSLKLGEHTLETRDENSFWTQSVISGYKFKLETEGEYYIRWEPFVADSSTYYNPVTFVTVIVDFSADVKLVPELQALPEIKLSKKVLN